MPMRNDRRRVAFLAVSSLGYGALGLTYLLEETLSRAQGFAWLPANIGPNEMGWVWIVTAVIAACSAVLSDERPKLVKWGFVSLIIPLATWSLIFLFAWLLGDHPTGYISTISYGMMGAWVWIVSAWPDSVADEGSQGWTSR